MNEISIRNTDFSKPNSKEVVAFGTEIRSVIYMIGVREVLSDEQIESILMFLHRRFKWLKFGQFQEAFELLSAGEFNGIEPKHYNSFDIVYIGQVMNAYRKWMNQKNLPINRVSEIREDERQLKLQGESERKVIERNAYEFIRDHISDNNKLPDPSKWQTKYHDAFIHAWKENIISMTRNEWELWKKEVVAELELERKMWMESDDYHPSRPDGFAMIIGSKMLTGVEARKRYMIDYFTNQLKK